MNVDDTMDWRIKSKMKLLLVSKTSGNIDLLKKLRNGDEQSQKCAQDVCNILEKTVCDLSKRLTILETESGLLHFQCLTLGHIDIDTEENVHVECCTDDNQTSVDKPTSQCIVDETSADFLSVGNIHCSRDIIPRGSFDAKCSPGTLQSDNLVFHCSENTLISENIDVQHSQEIPSSDDFDIQSSHEILLLENVDTQCSQEVPSNRTLDISRHLKTDLPGVKLKVSLKASTTNERELGKLNIDLRRDSIGEYFPPSQVTLTPNTNSFIDLSWKSRLTPEVMSKLAMVSKGSEDFFNKLGQGGFGCVNLLHCPSTGLLIADKTIDTKRMHLEDIYREVEIMKCMDHPRILQIFGHICHEETAHIFMEWMPVGSLKEFRQQKSLNNMVIAVYAKQILEGVAYMHARSIVHRDIKGANIFISSEGALKIADFGLARKLTDWEQDIGKPEGTYLFSAPEYLKKGVFTKACDIWSVGAVIVEMATGQSPWPHIEKQENHSLLYQIGTTDKPPEIPHQLTPALRDVVKQCFCLDPDRRPSAIELLQLDMFTSLNSEIRS